MAKSPSNRRDTHPAALDPLHLQAYFDGQLAEAEAAEVEALLASSEDDQSRLDALAEMRELVRFDLEQRIEDVDFEPLWGRIQQQLDPEARPARFDKASAAARPGWISAAWREVRAFVRAHRTVLVPSLVAAGLAGLVLTPMVMNQQPPDRVIEKQRTIVIVEPLRFEGDSTGAVSYTPQSNTPVIWYLGGGAPAAVPAAPVDAAPRITVPVDKILERLERLESLGWPQRLQSPPAIVPPEDHPVPADNPHPNDGPI